MKSNVINVDMNDDDDDAGGGGGGGGGGEDEEYQEHNERLVRMVNTASSIFRLNGEHEFAPESSPFEASFRGFCHFKSCIFTLPFGGQGWKPCQNAVGETVDGGKFSGLPHLFHFRKKRPFLDWTFFLYLYIVFHFIFDMEFPVIFIQISFL